MVREQSFQKSKHSMKSAFSVFVLYYWLIWKYPMSIISNSSLITINHLQIYIRISKKIGKWEDIHKSNLMPKLESSRLNDVAIIVKTHTHTQTHTQTHILPNVGST